jgi:DNA-binding winged helix-turn-helix (wHTH) protein
MNRLRRVTWKHCTGLVVGLAVGIGVIAGWLIHVGVETSIADARRQSRIDATGFAQAAEAWINEQAAEEWISVDARQSFHRVVELMLLGKAAYVQVVLGGVVIVDSVDAGWSSGVPLRVSGSAKETGANTIHSIRGRLLSDVVIPIGALNLGDPDGPTGYARVGYELATLTNHLQTIRLAGAGIALASFLVACTCAAIILAWLDHQAVLLSPFNGIVRSLCSVRARDPLVLDERAKQIVLHGKAMFLPPKLFHMLALLVQEKGRVLEEEEIVGTLWPEADLADSRDVRQCVYLLRKRLDAVIAGAGACIANVKGFGYRYDAASLEVLLSKHEPEPLVDH